MSYIPPYIRQKAVDENGYFTPEMHQFFDVFFQQANNNLSNDGVVMPPLSTQQIANINAPTNPNAKGIGTVAYNTDIHKLQVNENGVIKTIMTS